MPDPQERGEASALDAIELVASEGLNRNSSPTRTVVLAVTLLLVASGAAVYWAVIDSEKMPDLHDLPVAVFLPQKDEGLVQDNATRQWQGFELAFTENGVNKPESGHVFYFKYPFEKEDDTHKEIMNQIEAWYKIGKRVFIITMSGAVTNIKNDFTAWARTKKTKDRPFLVATVASAPDIARREDGILRNYIRSRDESDVLSTFIESHQATEVFVFYVDDRYGEDAKNIFKARLDKQTNFTPIDIQLTDGKAEVEAEVQRVLSNMISDEPVAVIVGYGGMINNTLQTLPCVEGRHGERFGGKILVVSTFTEAIWRPELKCRDENGGVTNHESFASRVRTVGSGLRPDKDDHRGVVFQFSFLTLDRAIKCGEELKKHREQGMDVFWNCWVTHENTGRGANWAEVEVTADGDSHVSLRLLDEDQW